MPKYYPLAAHLAAHAGDTVTLSFPEVEAIVGAPLPRYAWHPLWWTGSGAPGIELRRTLAARGWRVERVEAWRKPPVVTFARLAR